MTNLFGWVGEENVRASDYGIIDPNTNVITVPAFTRNYVCNMNSDVPTEYHVWLNCSREDEELIFATGCCRRAGSCGTF
jgi:hypothetical protein